MRISRGGLGAVGNRLGGITHVFIEALRLFRSLETKRVSRMEIQGAFHRFPRRPGVESAPAMRSRLEDVRFSGRIVRIILQVMAEKGQLDLFAVVLGGFGAEADRPQLLARSPAPFSVRPWSHHQGVLDSRVHPLGGAINLQRTEQILSIKPPSDRHDRATYVLQVRPEVPGLPESIISGVLQKLIPLRGASFQEEGV